MPAADSKVVERKACADQFGNDQPGVLHEWWASGDSGAKYFYKNNGERERGGGEGRCCYLQQVARLEHGDLCLILGGQVFHHPLLLVVALLL